MRKFIALCLMLVMLTPATMGCVQTRPPNLTPAASVAYNASEIAIRVREFQSAAFLAYDQGGIPYKTASLVNAFAIESAKALKQDTYGQMVASLWVSLKIKLGFLNADGTPSLTPPNYSLTFMTAFNALDAVLAIFFKPAVR